MIPTTCYCTQLRRASHASTHLYDQALEPVGLTVTQFSLLRTILRVERPYLSSLAEATGLERSTLGRNIRLLERAGLVEFARGEDARTKLVCMTRKGQKTLDDAVKYWQVAQDKMNAALGQEKLRELEALLDEVAAC